MKLLAFSDLHTNLPDAIRLVGMSLGVDAVVGVGDFASQHERLEETIEALSEITKPTVLVPGNNETVDALRKAASGWESATVLHGENAEIEGVNVFGLGGGIPETPWDWSFDLSDDDAATLLAGCPEGAVLAVHSPPKGHCDRDTQGIELGSEGILKAIEDRKPAFALCGHIHDSWGCRSEIGPTQVVNLGPRGHLIEV